MKPIHPVADSLFRHQLRGRLFLQGCQPARLCVRAVGRQVKSAMTEGGLDMGMAVASNTVGVLLGAGGVVFFVCFFGGLITAWWALGALRWEKFVLPLTMQANVLRFFLALVGGLLTGFVGIAYLLAVQALKGM